MNKIYTSDISVLVKLFTNKIENTIVFDTENKLVINNENDFLIVNNETELIAKSNQQTNLISLSTIVDTKHVTFQNCFDFTKNHFDNHSDFSYYFFNNPNGTMRWVYPISLKHHSFLTLYNASGWKSKVIQMAFKGLPKKER